MAKRKSTKGQTTIYKTLITKDKATRTNMQTWDDSGTPEEWAVPAPLVAPVVLL